MDRRRFLQFVLSVPLLGAAVLFVSPIFRYLKPTAAPFPHGMVGKPDAPSKVKDIRFPLSSFPEPWTVQEFVYEQRNPIYTKEGAQINKIPGFLLRIPGKSSSDYQFVCYSRICPHMGCIFAYVPDPHEAEKGFNYKPPKGTPVFACPCHLSVFDPAQEGKVVSGPAPRGPRTFSFELSGSEIVITKMESGGIA